MANQTLSHYFTLSRRYSRSVNLERDLEKVEALEGYVLTNRAKDALSRIWSRNHNAWTLTSVYGTGKSAFAHFLASLGAPQSSDMRKKALEIAALALGIDSAEYIFLGDNFPEQGYLRAVATGRREPISYTIIRALNRGIDGFWSLSQRNNIPIVAQLVDLETEIKAGNLLKSREIPEIVMEVAKASDTGVFLILDELGKNLEYAAYNLGEEDLYVLQQLAELPKDTKTPVYVLGVLHQAFADYGQRLGRKERNEWSKIQGRFEDIAFTESAGEMMRLIGESITQLPDNNFACALNEQATEWFNTLSPIIGTEDLSAEVFRDVYPLHPLTALVLPILCQRYAQNDRSLFTFLTSTEPYSFQNFIGAVTIENHSLPTLKLDGLYDYFIEAAGMGLASRPHLQRWVEIQELIADAGKQLPLECLQVLKTIGILNLITTTGTTRATQKLVTLAMLDQPSAQQQPWQEVIKGLLDKGIITHRRQIDELRIWQGSDFNVDIELANYLDKERSPLVNLLTLLRPLSPLVAQRHSYKTGTMRYFERFYLDNSTVMADLRCSNRDIDGLIGYWLAEELPQQVPSHTADGKPLIVVCGAKLEVLQASVLEFAALKKIQTTAPELQSDGVARKEVRYRLVEAERLLDETLEQAFDLRRNQGYCWVLAVKETIHHVKDFNAKLSEVCDRIYPQTPILWNELINRRELTSQGAKARRELIEAMVGRSEKSRLGLTGYGPEVTMYYSLLETTGIHRQEEDEWGLYPPNTSQLDTLWQTIEAFCLEATEKPQTLDKLSEKLAAPPYGVKQGAIPVILAAVLLYHVDDVGIYQDGTFIPRLGVEHFELLLKDASRFAVKYFEVVGKRSQVFRELESILRKPSLERSGKLRNATLLTVVTPLYQFVKKLPIYTQQTKRLTPEAIALLRSLEETTEPDELLFIELPKALGLPPIDTTESEDRNAAINLRNKLAQVLREIHTAFDGLLSMGKGLLYDAFGVSKNEQKLREDLALRGLLLRGKCVESVLKRFVIAAQDKGKSDGEWLESVMMVIADKPPESWNDEDVIGFEVKLADIARRFKNLEALETETTTKQEGKTASRITLTRSDGIETHRLLWVDEELEEKVNEIVNTILGIIPDNEQIRQAVLAKLTERILDVQTGEYLQQADKN
jgi:hypothetical protein